MLADAIYYGLLRVALGANGLTSIIFITTHNRYALTGKEVKSILMQRLVKVDGKVRRAGERLAPVAQPQHA
jgi:ribosomal protein S4E